jgi:hypothetical protein
MGPRFPPYPTEEKDHITTSPREEKAPIDPTNKIIDYVPIVPIVPTRQY